MENTELMTTREAADLLKHSVSTLARWRRTGAAGPVFIQVGPRSILYRRADLDAYIAVRRRATGGRCEGAER